MRNLLHWLGAFGFLALSSWAHAARVDFVPATSTVSVGTGFFVDIVGDEFLKPLDGGGFDLAYNPSVVRVDSLIIDSQFDFAPPYTRDDSAGRITDISFNVFSVGPSGRFNIARLGLTALAVGTSALELSANTFKFASDGNEVATTLNGGLVQVLAVPLPAALWLVSSGLLSIVPMARSRSGVGHG